MNKKELSNAVAEKLGTTKKAGEEAVDAILQVIIETLPNEDIKLTGFGNFEKKVVKGREGVCQMDAAKGKKWKTEDSFSVKFKCGKVLKDAINGVVS